MPRRLLVVAALLASLASAGRGAGCRSRHRRRRAAGDRETFTIASSVLRETRRINVYVPAGHAASPTTRLPVLYMPDGGLQEDFLHVAGLLQVSIGNGTMRPFLLVGIENTERRRDMTGPTDVAEDRRSRRAWGAPPPSAPSSAPS
jgi:enterochelin esterase-like enzyme